MRQKIAGLAAAIALMVSAAPAMACYNPCSQGLFNFGVASDHGYGVAYGHSYREQLPDPIGSRSAYGPQYYYVNQGPTYTGPGNLAPAPTYQERAVSGWYSYDRPYYYGYNGGPYGNATSHYYDGARVRGPAIYRYRAHRAHRAHRGYYHRSSYRPARAYRPHQRFQRPGTKYYYTSRPNVRYGAAPYAHAPRHGAAAGPRVVQRNGYARQRNSAHPHYMPRMN